MRHAHSFQSQSIPKLILSLSFPIMVSLCVQALYNIVDGVCISWFNDSGFTAISLSYPIQHTIAAIGNGVGVGTGIQLSRALGEGNLRHAERQTINSLFAALLLWLATGLILFPLVSPYFHTFSTSPEVIADGLLYCKTVGAASIFLYVECVCTRILQARGNTVFPMIYQALGAIVNMVLDPVLIFGVGPFPSLGILGAAVATIIGQGVSMFCAIAATYITSPPQLEPPHRSTICSIYYSGLPVAIKSALASLYVAGLNAILIGFSEDAVTAMGIYFKMQIFLLLPTSALEQGVLPVLGYHFGAKEYSRMWKAFWFSLSVSVLTLTAATVLIHVHVRPLLALFHASPALLKTAIPAMKIISLAFPMFSITIMVPVLLQTAGRLKECVFIVLLRQVFLLVPLAWVLSHWGLVPTWFTFPISEAVAVALCFVYLHRLRVQYPSPLISPPPQS